MREKARKRQELADMKDVWTKTKKIFDIKEKI